MSSCDSCEGVPPTEVDGFYCFSSDIIFAHFQFPAQGRYISCFLFALGGGKEIAVDATSFAKGNM